MGGRIMDINQRATIQGLIELLDEDESIIVSKSEIETEEVPEFCIEYYEGDWEGQPSIKLTKKRFKGQR